MDDFSFIERRLMISNSSKKNIPYLNTINTVFHHRVNLIKTLKIYIKKYYNFASNKNNILYLSILYLDIIISKEKISLTYDKNLKYLCLCCFILSLKLLGDFDLSKDIIRNFCENYKQEYKIFEMQCIELLEYNLIYTTAYDYINLILNLNEQNKLLYLCNKFLYRICEDELYIFYSPFYIAITVIQLSKNYLNEKSHNHYDKYFQDQRVKLLYKNFSFLLNENENNYYIFPKTENNAEIKFENENIFKNKKNSEIFERKVLLDKKNCRLYYKNRNYDCNLDFFTINNNIHNNNSIINKSISKNNITFLTNNNIQNNIVIINEVSKENKENINTINILKNKTPLKIIVNRYNQNNKSNYIRVEKNVINNEINYNNNTSRVIRIRNNKSKNDNYIRYRNSFKNVINFSSIKSINNENDNNESNNKYRKELTIDKGNNMLITKNNNNTLIKNQNKSSTNIKNKIIYPNKSSLNFKLLSNMPKDALYKLSRNLSKNLTSTLDKISVNKTSKLK